MVTIQLKRVMKNDEGTFGVLIHNYRPFALTYELPWHDNKKSISCIPDGQYKCQKYKSSTRGNCFRVLAVPGRSGILMHVGNVKKDTKGCILVGEEFGMLKGKQAVLSSKRGFKELQAILKKAMKREKTFVLDVRTVG